MSLAPFCSGVFVITNSAITCPKLTIGTPEQSVNEISSKLTIKTPERRHRRLCTLYWWCL